MQVQARKLGDRSRRSPQIAEEFGPQVVYGLECQSMSMSQKSRELVREVWSGAEIYVLRRSGQECAIPT